ncbi:hypothetical protein MTR_7g084360 [Medicago truncatula]|uniref:Isopenicillin N synthase-like Fe(2+) 2OG dioxygenase domain-containing protein n=1 Tax=Medicago truncatula TaxID=3880 RepID=G7KY97_MEDTR|nr:hypothetical protein MTR_7g084360 [Medicago truncatula]
MRKRACVSVDIMIQYSQKIKDMGMKIFELLSKALGPETSSYLKNLTCAEGPFIQGHYYLSCSESELTMGTNKHTDSNVMTLLLQDQLGGLQVLIYVASFFVNPANLSEDESRVYGLIKELLSEENPPSTKILP